MQFKSKRFDRKKIILVDRKYVKQGLAKKNESVVDFRLRKFKTKKTRKLDNSAHLVGTLIHGSLKFDVCEHLPLLDAHELCLMKKR